MANGVFYADAVNGLDANAGTSEALAKQTLAAVVALGTGGGNLYHIQAGGDYVLTAKVALALAGDVTDGPNILRGYTTVPSAFDGRPVITTATNSTPIFNFAANYVGLQHLRFTNTAAVRSHFGAPEAADRAGITIYDCEFDGFTHGLEGAYSTFFTFFGLFVIGCDFRNMTTAVWNGGGTRLFGNYFYNCENAWKRGVYTGIFGNAVPVLAAVRNRINAANKASSRGFYDEGNIPGAYVIQNNSFYDTADDAVRFSQTSAAYSAEILNNIFDTIRGYGVNGNAVKPIGGIVRNNAFRSITSGNYQRFASLLGDVALTGNPFTNPAAHDFTLNNTAGAGAAARGAGWPLYLDLGGLQSQASGSSGGMLIHPGMSGGLRG